MRDTPCAARGAEPLAFCSWRWGVAGRVDLPAEVGGGGPKGRRQGGELLPYPLDPEHLEWTDSVYSRGLPAFKSLI